MARFTYIPNRVIDTDGISDGASIYFYATGTTTPISIFTDEALTTPATNPYVVAAGSAVPPLYYADATIRVVVQDAGGATVSDDDPYLRPINQVELASTTAGKGASLVSFESGADVQDLEGTGGAAIIGKSGSGTVQDFIDLLPDIQQNGTATSRNLVAGGDYNITHADLDASNIFGGTSTQPNLVGQQYDVTQFTGDGSTSSRAVTTSFTVTDLTPAPTIIATGVRATDGIPLTYTVSNVSGYGTTSLTMDVQFSGAAPASGDHIEVVVLSNSDDSSADPTLITTSGYDNLVNPIMSAALGAHGVIGNGDGHNVIAGGSYGRIYGSYSGILGGRNNYIGGNDSTSVGCFILGRGVQLDGNDSVALGIGHDVTGDNCFYAGQQHSNSDISAVTITGRRGLAQSQGERIHAGGKTTDTAYGLYQVRELVLSGNTTDATLTNLANTNNTSTQIVPAKSAAMLRVEVAAIKDDYTKMEAFQGDFLLTEDNAGNCLVNGAATDQALTSISNVGTPGYAAAARGAGGGLLIRVTGASAENVRWVAYCRIVQTRYV